jgi:hypothetical protein
VAQRRSTVPAFVALIAERRRIADETWRTAEQIERRAKEIGDDCERAREVLLGLGESIGQELERSVPPLADDNPTIVLPAPPP